MQMQSSQHVTIYTDDICDVSSEDFFWVQTWLQRWYGVIRIAKYQSGGHEHVWDVEGPDDAIAEVPERLLCISQWSAPALFKNS